MTAVKICLETAPDNYEDMLKLGRFNLRLLAQELGVFASEKNKASFMQLKNEDQATELVSLVQQARGGGGKKPAARQPATGKTGATKKPGAAATSAPAEETTRAPVTDPAASRAPATAAAAAGASKSLELLKVISERCEGMIGLAGNVEGALSGLQSSIESLSAAVMFNSSLTLLSLEQAAAGQMSREDIISMALEEIPGIKTILEANAPADEEYTEEGNE
jgi:hypothetical protein